ncbi:MAG: MFS transporter [Clostridia bacterium]|nr:MFS transporter [Clostridia bacterium]
MMHLLLIIIYLAFIGMGLPDSMLGAAWPTMYPELEISVSFAGVISFIIAIGTIISALCADRLIAKFGTAKVTVFSIALSTLSLFGFSVASKFWMLCVFALPYGLAAGSIDSGLNNFAALHYKSRQLSWLHCAWGIGAIIGPYILGFVLSSGSGWRASYRILTLIMLILFIAVMVSLPLWKKGNGNTDLEETATHIPLKKLIRLPGVKEAMLAFFCYCALEQTVMLWAGSYMVLNNNISTDAAARMASLFFIGITVGRAICGFLTIKFSDDTLIRTGYGIIGAGILAMLLPLGNFCTFVGLILIGLGCAPVYPCTIHATPLHFGKDRSQSVISIQLASAYTGICLMPPLFGLIAGKFGVFLMPLYLTAILTLMIIMHTRILKLTETKEIQK